MTEGGTEERRAWAVLVSTAKPPPGQAPARWLLLELWPNGASAMTEWYGTTDELEERTRTPGVRWWTRAVNPDEDSATFTREAKALGETLAIIAEKIPEPMRGKDPGAKNTVERALGETLSAITGKSSDRVRNKDRSENKTTLEGEAWTEIEQAIDATLARFSDRWENCGRVRAGKHKGHKAHWITCVVDGDGEVHLLIDEDRVGEGAKNTGTVRGKAWTAYRPVAEPAGEAVWVAFRDDLAATAAQAPLSEEHIAARLQRWSKRLQIAGQWAGPRTFEFAWRGRGEVADTHSSGESGKTPTQGARGGVGAKTALILITTIVLIALHTSTTKTSDEVPEADHPGWSISPATHPGWSCAEEMRRISKALDTAMQSSAENTRWEPPAMNDETTHAVAQMGGEWQGYVEAREGDAWLQNAEGRWQSWNIGARQVAPCQEALPNQR